MGKIEESYEWYHEGISLKSLGKHEEAISCFDKSIKLNPYDDNDDNSSALYFKGDNDDNSSALYFKGISLQSLGKHEEAISCFDEVIELHVDALDAWVDKGISLMKLKRYEEAISCFDTLISVFEFEDSDKWYNKGIALEKLGKDEEAEQCFAKAKELEDS